MQSSSRLFRLSALLAATSLATAPILAQAQAPGPAPAPAAPGPAVAPPGAAPNAAATQNGDPPAMVGRLSQLTGTVSFHGPEDTQWSAATLNFPVSTGDAFWTEPQAKATIEFAGNRVDMQSQTEFDINQLDEQKLIATEPQGEVCMALANLPNGNTVTVQTPRGTVQIAASGHYAIAAGDTQNPTTVNVLDGAAQVTGNNVSLQVGPHQMATITGDQQLQGNVGPATQDPCLTAMSSPPPAPLRAPSGGQAAVAPPPDVQYMTGYEDLAQYGSWQQAPDYGSVWYPQVGSDWVPYREGRWAYVGRWGWTWVDNEPWGFAPFHYGRWAYINNRWGWVPAYPGAPVGRPVYAPALVSFFGVGLAVGAGVALGAALARGSVGWVPLGPRQPYYPWYRASPTYVRNVNIRQVTNVNVVVNNYNTRRFTTNEPIARMPNARAATFIPAAAMVGSRPVAQAMQHVDTRQLEQARPFVARDPVRPAADTFGLTEGTARRLGVPLNGRQAAPGPQVRAEELRGGHAQPPALRPVNAPGAAGRPGAGPGGAEALRPGEPNGARPEPGPGGRPGEPNAGRPGPAGMPALRAPGARPGEPGAPVNEQRPGGPGPAIGPRGPEGGPQGPGAGRGPEAGPQGPGAARGPEAAPRGPESGPQGQGAGRGPGAGPQGPGAARGPEAAPRGPEGAGGPPALRVPGARPGEPGSAVEARPGERPGQPAEGPRAEPNGARPGAPNGAEPNAARPGAPNGAEPHPGGPNGGPGRAAEPPRAGGPAGGPQQGPREAAPPRQEGPRPAPHMEAPHAAAPPHQEAPRPAPRAEAPRAAAPPHQEAPRPAPHVEAPHAAPPRQEAPHPAPPPRQEAPRPAPHQEAPRPAAPPHEAPHPAAAPHPQGGGGHPGGPHEERQP